MECRRVCLRRAAAGVATASALLAVLSLLLCCRLAAAWLPHRAHHTERVIASRATCLPGSTRTRMCSPVQTTVDPAVAALMLNLCLSRAAADWASLRQGMVPQAAAGQDRACSKARPTGLYTAAARRRLGSIVGGSGMGKGPAAVYRSATLLRSAAHEAVRGLSTLLMSTLYFQADALSTLL